MRNAQGFAQIALSETQLEQGLANYSDDDVPHMPIFIVALEPCDFERRWGVAFDESFDNLDYLKVAVLQTNDGLRISLIRHRGSPTPGTDVCVPEKVFGHNPAIAAEVMDALKIHPEDVVWSRGHEQALAATSEARA